MRLLISLGVGTAVERAGAPLRRFRYCTPQGDILAEIDLIELWKDVGPGVGVERDQLQDALLSELKGTPCRLGAWITALEQKSGCVSIRFNDGRSENYDLVIGADGIGSSVAFVGGERMRSELYRANGVAQFGADPPGHPGRSAILARRRMLFRPLSGQQ